MFNLICKGQYTAATVPARVALAVLSGEVPQKTDISNIKVELENRLAEEADNREFFLMDAFLSVFNLYLRKRGKEEHGANDILQAAQATLDGIWPDGEEAYRALLTEAVTEFWSLHRYLNGRAERISKLCEKSDSLERSEPVISYMIRRELLNWLVHGDDFADNMDATCSVINGIESTDPEICLLTARANFRFLL